MRGAQLAAFLAAAVPLMAGAQASDEDLAKQRYQTGTLYYERGDYEKSLAEFQEAYRLAARAELQYNIAQANEKLLRIEEAVAAYRAYLTGKPDAQDRKFVEQRIAFLEQQIEDKKKPAAPPPRPTPAARKEAPPPESGGWRRTAGWVAIGVGGAAAALGVVFGVIAKRKADDLEAANENGAEWADARGLKTSGERAEKIQIVGLAVGGAAIAAGVVLLLTAPSGGARAAASPGGLEVRW